MDPKPSSSDMSRRNYDVFLSFRGPDSRHTIVSHLSNALWRSGVYAFKDSEELEAGDRRADLFNAIEGSRIAVVVFSESYAGSKWCLDELTKIMERRNLGKLLVIPIFYKVDPSEVRLHENENGEKGRYQIAIETMESKHGKDWVTAKNWRKSLWEGGDLIGFRLLLGDDEGKVIDKVVEKVLKVLMHKPLHIAKYPVGIGRRLMEIKPLLHLDPYDNDVHMVGIHGLGGVGKTTLSKAICNDIWHEFDDWCFLPNIRETSKYFDGLVLLQQKLLQGLLRWGNVSVSSVDSGKVLIRERLCNKRVLIVLDDVDNLDQFDALAGNRDWFGEGSRIIITTRDSHVLTPDRVQHIYEIDLLELTDADDLFRRHAFAGISGKVGICRDLIDRFLRYADGLPLALTVLGSFLCGRNTSLWESTLKMLDKEPVQDINSVLKISFLGLDPLTQEIFLDIACFFKGWDKDYVMKVLDSCGFTALIKVQILVERCLLTVEDGKFQMHDLIEVMGKSIVRDGNAEMPSRIWTREDFRRVLLENAETNAVKGIVLNLEGKEDELFNPSTFKEFKRLRLLIIRNACNSKGFLHLPRQLGWFAWPGYSGSTIELDSSLELVGLDLQQSKVNQIKGMELKTMKYLNLSKCKSLERLPPNIFMCSELEDLNLQGCESLTKLDETTGSIGKLVHINLGGCHNLVRVPSSLQSGILRTVNFSGCYKLDKFPVIERKLRFLDKLVLDNTGIEELSEFMSNLVSVKYLSFANCKKLTNIPSSIYELRGLEILIGNGCLKLAQFPRKPAGSTSDVDGFPDLVRLELQNCYLKEVEFLRDLTCFETLKELDLSGNDFQCIPDCLSKFRKLEELTLHSCPHLVEVPQLPSVVKLCVEGCQKLGTLPNLHTFICQSPITFQVDLSNCHRLDATFFIESLQFEMQIFPDDVIVPGERIPYWIQIRAMPGDLSYQMPRPESLSKDDILGLMLSVTFQVRESGRYPSSVAISMVDDRLLIQRSDTGKFESVRSRVVYLPHLSFSHKDRDFMVDTDCSRITFKIFGQGTRSERFMLQVICRQVQKNKRFVVHSMVSLYDPGIDGRRVPILLDHVVPDEVGSSSNYGSILRKRNSESVVSKMVDKIFRRKSDSNAERSSNANCEIM